jgi:hypothetical protein
MNGRVEITTKVNSDDDTTSNYGAYNIDDTIDRVFWSFRPKIEGETDKAYKYATIPVNMSEGYSSVGINAAFVSVPDKGKKMYDGFIAGDAGEGAGSAAGGINFTYSNNPQKALEAKKETLKGNLTRSLSPLCSDKEKEIMNDIEYCRFARCLEGISGGIDFRFLKADYKFDGSIEYGGSLTGSHNDYFGGARIFGKNKDLSKNYGASIIFGGNGFNAGVGYEKINGNDNWKVGINAEIQN